MSMRNKKVVGFIMGLVLIVTPVSVHADAYEQQMISLLQQLVAMLTQQLNFLLAERGLTNAIIMTPTQGGSTTTPTTLIYTTSTTTYSIPVQNSPLRDAPTPSDITKPQIWEAQFGKDAAPEYEGRAVVRIVTSEAVDLTNLKWHFRDFPDSFEYVEKAVAVTVLSSNMVRDTENNCYVNCDRGGYVSFFEFTNPVTVTVPQQWSSNGHNNALFGPEFIVVDAAGNRSTPWQSARDIVKFIYE